MCGIAGIYRFGADANASDSARVHSAIEVEKHRGPDFQKVEQHNKICFGHARLSIIDTTTSAHQPMEDATGRYLIVYNGELFNYREIRKKLESKGFTFQNQSDTEVVINAYAHYGKDCLQHFNGFFAFAVYDKQTEQLFAARDRLGIKPFYYLHTDALFAFGSELAAVAEMCDEKRINRKALHLYFQLTYVPAPHSMIEGIYKLKPGHYIEIKNGGVTIAPYFLLPQNENKSLTFSESALRVKQELERSVTMRMVSDVPLGTFLSGGIDSSIVTALAASHKNDLQTFSLGFSDSYYLDESEVAEKVALTLGVKHHKIMVSQKDLSEHAENMLNTLDEPFADSSAVAVYALSKYTSQHVKVALSGDGADELFGGYRKHRALLRTEDTGLANRIIRQAVNILPNAAGSRSNRLGDTIRKISKYGKGLAEPLSQRYWNWLEWTPAAQISQLLLRPERDVKFEEDIKAIIDTKDLNSILLADLQVLLPNDMLTKTDRMSMAHGLEVRTPFLDHELVAFITCLPFDFKLNQKNGKLLLREAFRSELPDFVFDRPKKGFEIPIENWLRHELKSDLIQYSNKQLIERQSVFNYDILKSLIESFLHQKKNHLAPLVWSFLVFQYWWLRHFDNS